MPFDRMLAVMILKLPLGVFLFWGMKKGPLRVVFFCCCSEGRWDIKKGIDKFNLDD